jgi:hypothetical protein
MSGLDRFSNSAARGADVEHARTSRGTPRRSRLRLRLSHLTVGLTMTLMGAAWPAELHAQEALRDVLGALLLSQQSPNDELPKDLVAAAQTLDTVSQLVLVETGTQPIGPSAGGFIYRFNPGLATFERQSPGFGPFFTERVLGVGRGAASIGMTVRAATFNRLQGESLSDGAFPMNASRPVGAAAPNDVDTIDLELAARTVTAFGRFGITDRLDVGIAVPFVDMDIRGTRVNTFRGVRQLQASRTGDAAGFGDVAVRSRYTVAGDGRSGFAAGVDLRLPTGRAEDLLGAGRTAARFFGIVSREGQRVGLHLNTGVSVGGITRELSQHGAVTYAASPRVTIVGEVIARYLSNLHRVRDVYAPHATVAGIETMRWIAEEGGEHQVLTAGGMKVNVGGGYLLNANVLIRLSDVGVAARMIPSLTLDYTFAPRARLNR